MATQRLVVEQVILSELHHGETERYELDDEGARRIARAIALVVERPHAVIELHRVLELAVALEKELDSPGAADRIEQILRENRSAVALIAMHIVKSGALDETRAFKAREGRDEPLLAPRIDSNNEEESVRLAEFLDPASSGRIRQVSRRRGEAHDRGSQRDQVSRDSYPAERGARR
jgi:hypothetical protein